MCIVIACEPGCDIINFEIKFISLRQCQIGFLFSVAWKKFNAQCAKIISFSLKKIQRAKRNFFHLFYFIYFHFISKKSTSTYF